MDGVRIKKMSGSKAPDYDTYGLLRTTCSHNPTQHSHIMVLTPHFYAHIGCHDRTPVAVLPGKSGQSSD